MTVEQKWMLHLLFAIVAMHLGIENHICFHNCVLINHWNFTSFCNYFSVILCQLSKATRIDKYVLSA